MRNVLAHGGTSWRRVVAAFIATAFAQEMPEAASAQWRAVADKTRPKVSKLAAIMERAEPDVLAYMAFPTEHRAKLHSINPVERIDCEIKRRRFRQPGPSTFRWWRSTGRRRAASRYSTNRTKVRRVGGKAIVRSAGR